jgi:hypothetical protein
MLFLSLLILSVFYHLRIYLFILFHLYLIRDFELSQGILIRIFLVGE